MKRPMVTFLIQLLRGLRSRWSRHARLEVENLLLRQQLIVLRRRHPGRVRLWNIDRNAAGLFRRTSIPSYVAFPTEYPTGCYHTPICSTQLVTIDCREVVLA
jgi:hypothetical protein